MRVGSHLAGFQVLAPAKLRRGNHREIYPLQAGRVEMPRIQNPLLSLFWKNWDENDELCVFYALVSCAPGLWGWAPGDRKIRRVPTCGAKQEGYFGCEACHAGHRRRVIPNLLECVPEIRNACARKEW